MTTQKHFCTCKDTDCKLNPCNHSLGCDPCVRKNLMAGEIPGCFFHLIDDDLSRLDDFTVEGFVRFYLQSKAGK